MCRCLKVSPSGYCDWEGRAPSARDQDITELAPLEGKLFLCVVLALFSKVVRGW